ncbi:MAG: M48 family metallopeptidase [Acidiferrobacterales bacterium]
MQLKLGDLAVEVIFKDIKHVHLGVYPPSGRVRISAPVRTSLDTLRVFAISKLAWIRQQQQKLQAQARETPREYLDRESHDVWGRRYLLRVVQGEGAPSVELTPRHLVLTVRPGANQATKEAVIAQWYRDQVKALVPALIAKWAPVLDVRVKRVFVQQMKTKWGSCNPRAGTIRLNTELAKKPKECLEYIVAHELVHLIEPTHNAQFVTLMDRFMPRWQFYRQRLNRLPVRHADWGY